jgi:hypothetical protein
LIDHIATLAYAQIHDRFLTLKNELGIKNPGHFGLKCRVKDAKITICEAACLAVLFQSSRSAHFKQFLDGHRPALLRLFPTLPSYSRLVKWLPRAEQLLLDLAKASAAEPGGRDSVYAIDSTKIDPHKLKNNPKAIRRQVGFGHTHEGVFLGLKLHVLANRQGKLVDFDLTTGNVHDLAPVKGGMLRGVSGICFADSGYVSEQVRQDLRAQDLALVAKPTEQMVDQRWLFDRIWKGPYRQRQIVEGVFARLKGLYGLLACSCRSAASLRARVYASIAAFNLFDKPAS